MRKRLSLLLALALALTALLTFPTVALTEGEPIKIVYYNNSGKLGSTGLAGSNEVDFKEVHDKVLEATGIDVEVIIPPVGSEKDKLNTLLASQSQLDFFYGNWTEYKDAIQPITGVINEYGKNILAAWSDEAIIGMTNPDGEIMGIMRNTPTTPYPVFLRSDWLEKCGLEYPTTIDELENVLKTFKEQDPAGNGQSIALGADRAGLNYCLSAAFTGVGYGNFIDEDGRVKPVEVHPDYKLFLEKMADWYTKGYIYPEAFSSTRAIYNELITQGNFGGWAYWYSLTTLRSPYLTANMPEAKYVRGPIKSDKGYAETHTVANASGGLIPAYSKNAEAVVKFVDWQFADVANHLLCDMGIMDKHWKYTNEEIREVEILTTEAYIGEFVASQGLPMETSYSLSDPFMKMHNSYLKNEALRFDATAEAGDWFVIYDQTALSDACMTKGDIDRMIEEETVKFITGIRPVSEWETFVKDLYAIGLDQLIDARTAQYEAQKQ